MNRVLPYLLRGKRGIVGRRMSQAKVNVFSGG